MRWPPSLGRKASQIAGAVGAGLLMAGLLYLSVGVHFRVDAYGEGLYDLHYLAAGWLQAGWPTPELWAPGGLVQHYYNFGLASWGWLGGALGLGVGSTYVLGLIALPAAVFALCWLMLAGPYWYRIPAAIVATFPATGLSLIVGANWVDVPGHLRGMAHVRLPEWADRAGDLAWAQALMNGQAYPIESLAHLILELQDLHPPVWGVLVLALLLLWFLGGRQQEQPAERHGGRAGIMDGVLPGALLPLAYAVNAWMVPLYMGVLSAMLILRRRVWLLPGIVLGAAAAGLLLWWPFFAHFESTGAVQLNWVPAAARSKLGQWSLIWWPQALATLAWLALCWQDYRRGRSLAWSWALLPAVFLMAVLSLELILLDDAYSGAYERFNSVLKTGSLALFGWTASLLILASRRPHGTWGMVLMLALLAPPAALQIRDVGARYLEAQTNPNWYLHSQAMLPGLDNQALVAALCEQTPGTVLAPISTDAYNLDPAIPTLCAMPTWSGWAAHLRQIDSFSAAANRAREALKGWYANPSSRLLADYGVDYVLISFAQRWSAAKIAEAQRELGTAWRWQPVAISPQGHHAGFFATQALACSHSQTPARIGCTDLSP